jgi:hypothetical protein
MICFHANGEWSLKIEMVTLSFHVIDKTLLHAQVRSSKFHPAPCAAPARSDLSHGGSEWGLAGAGVNVVNLVEGEVAVEESPKAAFEPFAVHCAETFIVPAKVGAFIIRSVEALRGRRCATMKAFVRDTPQVWLDAIMPEETEREPLPSRLSSL